MGWAAEPVERPVLRLVGDGADGEPVPPADEAPAGRAVIDLTGPEPLVRRAAPPVIPRQAEHPAADRIPLARPELGLGPFRISDLSQDDVVSAIVSGAVTSRGQRPWVTYALHVGGLNDRRDVAYLGAMSRADLVYADGMSVILLAKLAGAQAAERAGTTDIGWAVLDRLNRTLGRPTKVALVGGPVGLAERAAAVLEADGGVEVVLTEHGYHDDWTAVFERLADSGCDMVVVGLGAPREMKWVDENLDALPACLVMTCGGWFGFITEDEKRAPQWVCASGLEWTYRLAQSPRRLCGRYLRGAFSTARLAVQILRDRSGRVEAA